MRAPETVRGLSAFERRGPGTDAERRAAGWLADGLAEAGRDARIEPFWCRPNWALAHVWHTALALAGSLLSVHSPRVGGALLVIALISILADVFVGISPGRRLTAERASQNVVAGPPGDRATPSPDRVRLIVTANYDAGRTGLAYRDPLRVTARRLRRSTGDIAPGWLGWLALAITWLLIIAILRLEGNNSGVVGIAQLPPTVGLVLALALLIEIATAAASPAAGDNGSGVAAAIALVRALDAAPPRHLDVEVVLQGAGDSDGIGLRRHLRERKRELRPANAVVLGIAPCPAGLPHFWVSDGELIPMRYFGRLRQLCARVAAQEPDLGLTPHRGRGVTPAFPARRAGIPAIAIGCLDERGVVPRSHQSTDTPQAIEPDALDQAVEVALILVDAIDANIGARSDRATASA